LVTIGVVVVAFGIAVVERRHLLLRVVVVVLIFVLAEGGSFAGGVDVVLVIVLVLASSLEGEVLLHRHGVVSGRRSVCGRRQHCISSVGSVVPEAHILAVILEVSVFVHAVVPATRVVIAVVFSTRVVA
jgi:hypothetical protein